MWAGFQSFNEVSRNCHARLTIILSRLVCLARCWWLSRTINGATSAWVGRHCQNWIAVRTSAEQISANGRLAFSQTLPHCRFNSCAYSRAVVLVVWWYFRFFLYTASPTLHPSAITSRSPLVCCNLPPRTSLTVCSYFHGGSIDYDDNFSPIKSTSIAEAWRDGTIQLSI